MEFPGEKLVIKLWDSIFDRGIASLLKPWQIRREGRAIIDVRREDALMLAQLQSELGAIRSGEKVLLRNGNLVTPPAAITSSGGELVRADEPSVVLPDVSRIVERNMMAEAVRREIGLAKAVLHAENELRNDQDPVPDTSVTEDWLLRWRDCAADVSSDELQSLWGKVLAGEVKEPGRFSFRTLEFLRNLSQDEAKAIARLSPFVFSGIVFRTKLRVLELEQEGLDMDFLLAMQELGVVTGVDSMGLTLSFASVRADRFESALTGNGRVLFVKAADAAKEIKINAYPVTAIGKQVLQLGTFTANEIMIRHLGNAISSQGFDVQMGDCYKMEGTKIGLKNLQPLPPINPP